MKAAGAELSSDAFEPIAIVGMSGRFPGAANVEAYWKNLVNGVESISFFSDTEMRRAGVPANLLNHPDYVKAQGVLEEIETFDAVFFGLSPGEAAMMDPQHRIFLECAWEALENAGCDADRYDGRIGVYAGSGLNTYLLRNLVTHPDLISPANEYSLLVNNDKDYMPTRVSYKLNLKGPSMNVGTACSSSLVAVHLARQSLLNYQCDMALAGGVTIQVPRIAGYLYENGGPQSPDGHCRAFDAEAKGMVGGSGAGIVALMRLGDAQARGYRIHAEITGSAVNNDGKFKVGYTAPGVDGQAEVIAEAQAVAGAAPDSIGYIEAHGTGTVLGDPIEIAGLTKAFRAGTDKKGFCAVGSVKTNIGHLDSAAGVAGLIKTVKVLEHGKIPATLHFKTPNPEIDFDNSPFYVNTRLSEWKTNADAPRRAGVSAFGIGGTNAHVIVQQALSQPPSKMSSRPVQVVVLSAQSESALDKMTANLCGYLKKRPGADLADIAFTLGCGRKAFHHRRVVISADAPGAARALAQQDPGLVFSGLAESNHRPVAFLFPGRGAPYVNMGLGPYRSEPVFRRQVDHCCRMMEPELGLDLRDALYPREGAAQDAEQKLTQTSVAQSALFILEYALSRMWISWGVKPSALAGQGIGEFVAATLSGVFSLETALALVAARARLMLRQPQATPSAAGPVKERATSFSGSNVFPATESGPSLCVVPAHSDAQSVPEPLAKWVGRFQLNPPQIPFISNLTGAWITTREAMDPTYWARHLCHGMRFFHGPEPPIGDPEQIFLEVGPVADLHAPTKKRPESKKAPTVFHSMRHPRDGRPDMTVLLTTLAKLWLAGTPVDWEGFYANETRRRLSLPTYPFERRRYWVKPTQTFGDTNATQEKTDIEDWFYAPSWRRSQLHRGRKIRDNRRWLIFSDSCGIGAGLAGRLAGEGREIILVEQGAAFTRAGDGAYRLDPAQGDHYQALFDDLRRCGKMPQTILHLWSVTRDVPGESTPGRVHGTLNAGYYSLLNIVRSMGVPNPGKRIEITVLSNHMQEVTGEEMLSPEKATILGPVKVIPKEYPGVFCRSIDVVLPEPGERRTRNLVTRLHMELTGPAEEPVVALRGRHRWVQTFEPLNLKRIPENKHRLREKGVYLITGGLGGIGLMLAEYLARTVKARLVLTGRSPFPPREQWNRWVAANSEEGSGFDPREQDVFLRKREKAIIREFNIRGIDHYAGLEESVNRLCAGYLYAYLQSAGIRIEKGSKYQVRELQNRLGIISKFEKFFDYFITVLAEDSLVRLKNGRVEFLKSPAELSDPLQLKQELDERFPEFNPLFAMLEHCADHYRDALSGAIEAISVLYPEGESTLLEDTLNNTIEHTRDRVYITLLCDLIDKNLEKKPHETLKILEVGAGEGGFTNAVAPRLQNRNVEYVCTDIGRSFVLELERKTRERGYDCMIFGELDVSKDPDRQGFEGRQFDMIIGLDVIHATRRIEDSIEYLKKMLTPNGGIYLLETVKTRRWTTMVYGLAEGWWYFEDAHIRKNSPLLDLGAWETVFYRQNFNHVRAYPADAADRLKADCGLIVAQNPGPTDAHRNPYSVIRGSGRERIENRIRKLRELEALGARVMVVDADVSDMGQMQSAIDRVRHRFGDINGVIHAAAIENRGPIQLKSKVLEKNEFSAKIIGTRLLNLLFKDTRLDILALCSSISSISPGVGDVEYCAANAFLDLFAQNRASDVGRFTVSIDWDRWQNVGMSTAYESLVKSRTGVAPAGGMPPAKAVEAFSRILLQGGIPQIIVSTTDFQARVNEEDLEDFFQSDEKIVFTERREHPVLQSEYASPESTVEKTIARIWERVLGVRQVGIHDNFLELGGDSLIAIKVISRLREALGVELAVNRLFETPTVAQLAQCVQTIQWAARGASRDACTADRHREEGTI